MPGCSHRKKRVLIGGRFRIQKPSGGGSIEEIESESRYYGNTPVRTWY